MVSLPIVYKAERTVFQKLAVEDTDPIQELTASGLLADNGLIHTQGRGRRLKAKVLMYEGYEGEPQ